MTAPTRSQSDDARAQIESWAALGEACREAGSEQITVTSAGVWTVHARRQITRQPHVPGADVLSRLIDAVEQAGDVRAFSDWVFSTVPGSLGATLVGSRAPRLLGDWLDADGADALRAHVERGACGLIVCPPGATGASVLSWLAQLYDTEQIVLVSPLPAPDDLGPRVLHAYPPETEGARQRLSRLLRRAPVVLWDGVEQPSDARTAFGYAGATRRWMTLAASDPIEGLEAFAGLRGDMPTRWLDVILALEDGPRLTHLLSRGGEGWREEIRAGISCLPVVDALFPSNHERRTVAVDWSGAPGLPGAPEIDSGNLSELRATVADPIMELDTAPNYAVSPSAASSLQEIFEDSDASIRISRSEARETRPNDAIDPELRRNQDAEQEGAPPSLADLVDQLDQESSPSIPALRASLHDSPPTQEIVDPPVDDDDDDEGQILSALVREISSGPVDPYSLDPDEFLAPHEATIPSAGHESFVPSHMLSASEDDDPTNLVDVSRLREEDERARVADLRDSGEIDLQSIMSARQAVEEMRDADEDRDAVTSSVPSRELESALAQFGVDMDEAPSSPPVAPEGVELAAPHDPTAVVSLPGSSELSELSWSDDESTETHTREPSPRPALPPLDDDFDLEPGAAPSSSEAPSSSTSVRLSALSLKLKALRQQRREQDD